MVELTAYRLIHGGLYMKNTTTIISVLLTVIIPTLAGSIPELQPHILLSSPVNQDNPIDDNSIDIDDSAFTEGNNTESAEGNRDDKPQMNKY
jgi:hypothetical protein